MNVAEDDAQSLEQKTPRLDVPVKELNERHMHTMMGQRTRLERQMEELRSSMQQQIAQLRSEADLALQEHDGQVERQRIQHAAGLRELVREMGDRHADYRQSITELEADLRVVTLIYRRLERRSARKTTRSTKSEAI